MRNRKKCAFTAPIQPALVNYDFRLSWRVFAMFSWHTSPHLFDRYFSRRCLIGLLHCATPLSLSCLLLLLLPKKVFLAFCYVGIILSSTVLVTDSIVPPPIIDSPLFDKVPYGEFMLFKQFVRIFCDLTGSPLPRVDLSFARVFEVLDLLRAKEESALDPRIGYDYYYYILHSKFADYWSALKDPQLRTVPDHIRSYYLHK